MPEFNFEYICAEIIRHVTVSYNLVNLVIALLMVIFLLTALLRKLNWVIIVLVVLILLGGMYFTTLNIEYSYGCDSTIARQFEWLPGWWQIPWN